MNLLKKFYSQDTIQHQFLDRDIKLWREELEGIEEEIIFLKNFFETAKNTAIKELISDKLTLKLNVKQLENEVFLSRLNNFSIKLEGMNECDDIQCETFYFNDFVDFKIQIESFLSQYRKLKKTLFLKINSYNKSENSF
ncbi:hypothetical protein M0M57_04615 [Flavobacterium azooxidireducens]|uniref:Uncharacterized protein n=1 Tax=Flavobacterium azooxidireducens TaxID=1871076 RepID=A0ABY4KHF3_9FLAO|nr:hypothetical protein [Flavobacterium azooxidireducens]UPQ80119.1 hypothetical protein M0M57_04615 [Flavobacterium azooxidireducens]